MTMVQPTKEYSRCICKTHDITSACLHVGGAFFVAVGSWSGFLWSMLGHIAMLCALAVTIATYKVAEKAACILGWGYNPQPNLGRRIDGEHE